MPPPKAIRDMGRAAHDCGTFELQFQNPKAQEGGRATLTRNYHVYLEVAMQAKHDELMRGYCRSQGIQGRKADGTQVKHVDTATAITVLQANNFYWQKARIAADVVKDQMVSKWQDNEGPVFTVGARVDAAVQYFTQVDGYQYEISYWYENKDIYVLFHCYPPKK